MEAIGQGIENMKTTIQTVISDNTKAQDSANTQLSSMNQQLEDELTQAMKKIADTFVELHTVIDGTKQQLAQKVSETEAKFSTGEARRTTSWPEAPWDHVSPASHGL